MRYILIILVFLSAGAKAQMVIKAHANYRPYAQPAANLLLDDYPNAAAAYSLRKLDKDYTGAAIRVRKDTTGQPEQDIGFTASGDLDTAALKSFLNARSGFVTTWYSQGDSTSVNFAQSTQANQPRIALNGVIERRAGKPAVFFDGSNDFMQVASSTSKFNFLHRAAPSQISAAVQFGTSSNPNNYYVLLDNNGTSNGQRGMTLFYDDRAFVPRNDMIIFFIAQTILSINANNYFTPNEFKLLSFLQTGGTGIVKGGKLYLNGGNEQTATNPLGSGGETGNASFNMTLGRTANTSDGPMLGYVSEIVMWSVDNTSNRTGIENNINDYYNIYWNGDFTGLLDTYGSSAAAYSLRNLSSTYTGPLIRVRKDTTGQPEQDIYGDYYGNLDTVGLKNFLNARSGFVTTWYDQSGNGRNASQATQASQPRIANLGVLERLDGQLSIWFDNDRLQCSTSYTITRQTSFFAGSMNSGTQNGGRIFTQGGNANDYDAGMYIPIIRQSTNNAIASYHETNYRSGVNVNLATQLLFSSLHTGTVLSNQLNNNTAVTNNTTLNVSITTIALGRETSTTVGGGFLVGMMHELIVYNSDQTTNRTGIRNNINTYYGIY